MDELTKLDPRFDRFLYAPLCERDEITVSVLSALTRQNIDPWQFADCLTRLPKAQAAKSLACIVEASSGTERSPSEANEIAVRLIEFLPSQKNSSLAPASTESLRAHLAIWVMYGIFWGTLAVYAGTSQQTEHNYRGLSASAAVVSNQSQRSPQQPGPETSSAGVLPASQ
jgi:hypothetical protein